MGQISSDFQKESDIAKLPNDISPEDTNWITSHAVAASLSIVEVERLWKRFQQLGCNSNGELGAHNIKKKGLAADVFIKNILTALKSPNGNVKFLTFLNCMKWAEISSHNDKITAIYNLLNAGETVNRQLLMRLVKRVYPEQKKERYDELTDGLLDQLGCHRTGVVTLDQFVEHVNIMPSEMLNQLFNFLIIPKDINEEAQKALSRLSDHHNGDLMPQNNDPLEPDISDQVPTDGLLHRVAAKVHKHDWHLLANQLGFTASDIKEFEKNNARDSESQVFAMLSSWRRKGGSMATCGVLEDKLHQCNMNDAAVLLYP